MSHDVTEVNELGWIAEAHGRPITMLTVDGQLHAASDADAVIGTRATTSAIRDGLRGLPLVGLVVSDQPAANRYTHPQN